MDYKNFRDQMSSKDAFRKQIEYLASRIYYARADFKKAKLVLPSDINNQTPLTRTQIKCVINKYNSNDTYASLGQIKYLYNSTRMDGKGYTYQIVYEPESLLNLKIDRLLSQDLDRYLEDVKRYAEEFDIADDIIKKVIDIVEKRKKELSEEKGSTDRSNK